MPGRPTVAANSQRRGVWRFPIRKACASTSSPKGRFACSPPHRTRWLEAGDVVLLPHGTGHIIADEPRRQPRPLEDTARSSWATRLTGSRAVEMRSLIVCCTVLSTVRRRILLGSCRMYWWCADPLSTSALPILLDLLASEVASQRIGRGHDHDAACGHRHDTDRSSVDRDSSI